MSTSEGLAPAVDPWTAVHVAAGLAAGLMNIPLRWTLAAGAAYEVVEQVFERSAEGQEFFDTSGPERVPNALFDLAVRRTWASNRGRRSSRGVEDLLCWTGAHRERQVERAAPGA